MTPEESGYAEWAAQDANHAKALAAMQRHAKKVEAENVQLEKMLFRMCSISESNATGWYMTNEIFAWYKQQKGVAPATLDEQRVRESEVANQKRLAELASKKIETVTNPDGTISMSEKSMHEVQEFSRLANSTYNPGWGVSPLRTIRQGSLPDGTVVKLVSDPAGTVVASGGQWEELPAVKPEPPPIKSAPATSGPWVYGDTETTGKQPENNMAATEKQPGNKTEATGKQPESKPAEVPSKFVFIAPEFLTLSPDEYEVESETREGLMKAIEHHEAAGYETVGTRQYSSIRNRHCQRMTRLNRPGTAYYWLHAATRDELHTKILADQSQGYVQHGNMFTNNERTKYSQEMRRKTAEVQQPPIRLASQKGYAILTRVGDDEYDLTDTSDVELRDRLKAWAATGHFKVGDLRHDSAAGTYTQRVKRSDTPR